MDPTTRALADTDRPKVDETISQDHTDTKRVDPLASKDTNESSSSGSEESPAIVQPSPFPGPSQHPRTIFDRQYTRPSSPSTLSSKSVEDLAGVLGATSQGPEYVGPEYETLRDIMKSIPGLEFYKDRDYCRVVDFLLATISKLKVENTMLKKDINSMRVSTVSGYNSGTSHENNDAQTITPNVTETSGYEVCHQVDCIHPPQGRNVSYFRDVPMLFKGDTARDHIRGQVQIPNPAKYFEEHTNIEFIVIQVYCCDQSNTAGLGIRSGRLIADSKPTEIIRTKIAIRPSLLSAIKTTMNHHRSHFEGYDSSRISDTLTEPFLFFYIHNKTFVQLSQSSSLEPCDIEAIQLLCSYFEENWRKDWDDADHLFSRGKVNMKHFSKLFHPGEVILTKSRDGQEIITAKQVADYHSAGPFDNFVTFFEWQFNGQFQKVKESYSLRQVMTQSTLSKFNLRHGFLKRDVDSSEQIDDNTEKDITSLPAYPLRFSHDAQRIKDELVSRGLKFWKYRKQTLVCYVDQKVHEENQAERRFMIDYEVFRRIHPKNEIFEVIMDDLGQEVMNQDQPPRDNFLACLPAHIHGYDLSEKTWKLIRVDQTTDVTWNKNIFKQLVLPSHDKELIQAVVTAHGQKMSGTADIIGGKGQGVLLLLHGGPGTGKTLTAEGIAEEQERPLYRVTCGDIGVEPEDVERYLKYVLEIGRAWGCVVLLDEADVFLEERSPADHKRNAVISIFLRVLEYYDGILILTTNRVGSFDEAFKSRIHLSLGYPNLNEEQREQIWGNFFQLLDGKNERFDIQDLKLNVQKLAKHEINGRQIRNAVMIARHLAKFRKQALVYRHVQEAVAAVVKFNEYLQTVKGASDDDFAEYDRLRARIS